MNCCIRALKTVKVTYFNSKKVVNAGNVFSQSIKEGSEREKVKWGGNKAWKLCFKNREYYPSIVFIKTLSFTMKKMGRSLIGYNLIY